MISTFFFKIIIQEGQPARGWHCIKKMAPGLFGMNGPEAEGDHVEVMMKTGSTMAVKGMGGSAIIYRMSR